LSLSSTTSQTVGPFFRVGLDRLNCADLAGPETSGQRVVIEGRVLDGDGAPVPDAVIEIWQANALGKYDHPEDQQNKSTEPGFKGYGRVATDDQGRFCFRTIKPGPVPGPEGTLQAPHLAVSVFMRGLLKRLVTRVYFAGDHEHAKDPILLRVDAERRATLIARPSPGNDKTLHWDIILQGAEETVFFDC
jgi:protocatechuate 3,4-dioxygenase, alpha subunit